jgi:hypothetical protein
MNDRTNKGDSELGILARRKIEAAIIAPIYDEMRQALGEEKARDILRRAIRRAAIDAGTEMAARRWRSGSRKLQGDPAALDEGRRADDRGDRRQAWCARLQRQALSLRGDYRAMGLGEIGDILSCNRDGAFCEGYDPRIKLTRTQTIMGGASHCDFRYRSSSDPRTSP